MKAREKKYLAYGAAAVAVLLLAQPGTTPRTLVPPKTPPRPGPAPTKPKPAPAGKDGDVISYVIDTTLGLIVVKTHESPDVEWGTPRLKDDKIPKLRAMMTKWGSLIDEVGVELRIPSNEIAAIMWSESGGDQRALSNRGARGLMQVMPFNFPAGTSDAQMYDPRTNVKRGAQLLAASRNKGHDLIQMASWYNAGGDNGTPYTNESYVKACKTDQCRKDRTALMTRWGYPSQPSYIDTVVAAFNSAQTLARAA